MRVLIDEILRFLDARQFTERRFDVAVIPERNAMVGSMLFTGLGQFVFAVGNRVIHILYA